MVTGDELNVVGLGDGQGNSLGLVGIKKIWVTVAGQDLDRRDRQARPDARYGRASSSSTCCWRGPFELECMIADDEVYLIEINPRFPAWIYAATGAGLNLPAPVAALRLGLPSRAAGRVSRQANSWCATATTW